MTYQAIKLVINKHVQTEIVMATWSEQPSMKEFMDVCNLWKSTSDDKNSEYFIRKIGRN